MISLAGLLKSINECVISRTFVDGCVVLAKNRDRMYSPELEVIHELVNGIEVVYMHDILTDWSEGMNSNGSGIVNASLSVVFDEKEGDLARSHASKGKSSKPSYDGLKIRKALSCKKLSETIRSIISYKGEDYKDVGVKGMTMVANPKNSFVIEMTSKHLPSISRIQADETAVRTNHGVEYPDAGYGEGIKRTSSKSRRAIAVNALGAIASPDEVLDTLSKQHTTDKFMNPYRRDNSYNISTSSQVLLNLTDLKFEFRYDAGESTFKGFVNKLPKGYEPKIQVKITTTVD